MIFILISILMFFMLFLYSALKISSIHSRLEEEREFKWQQQEYGRLKKD